MSVKIIFVCHNKNSVDYVISLNISEYSIIYVGKENATEDIKNNPRIIVARNFENNIESKHELLTFTAWYLISKNNLFSEYEYLCILEWDVTFNNEFVDKLTHLCSYLNNYEVISFSKDYCNFYRDVNVDVLNYSLQKINTDPNNFNCNTQWFSSTNHCVRRDVLNEFVDLYYPLACTITLLDHNNISWYHERIFSTYITVQNKLHFLTSGLDHYQRQSHGTFKRSELLPGNLVRLFLMNDSCEYLNKLVHNYDIFNKLFQSCHHVMWQGMPSYLFDGYCYTYSNSLYEKQKKLFDIAKKSKYVLEVGSYMSHSLFIMLLANPSIKITCIDIDDTYSISSIKVLENMFSTTINFIKGDYKNVIPLLNEKYDLIHFDTSNSIDDIKSQFNLITTSHLNELQNSIHFIVGQSEHCDETFKNTINYNTENGQIFCKSSSSGVSNMLVFEYLNCNTVLKKLAYTYGTDKLSHGYISFYENYFNSFKNDVFNFLEIGVFFGSSIRMWSKFFPNATIYGVDHFTGHQGNNHTFTNADKFWKEVNNSNDNELDNVELVLLDQSNENHLINFKKRCVKKNLTFKVILDDGSHLMRDQQISFYYLFDLLEDGGIYIIEDIHTSEQSGYDVILDGSNSTKKIFKNMQNGSVFNSCYVSDDDKCKKITDQILDIKVIEVDKNSQFVVIFKK
jgi:predicted O-methyltransferase YrrM